MSMSGQYTWADRFELWLPMRMEQHDPDNSRTLNIGKAGSELHGVVRAGSPVKKTDTSGYSFAIGDSFKCSDSYANPNGVVTVVATVTPGAPPAPFDTIFSWEYDEAINIAVMLRFGNEIWFFTGGITTNNAAIIDATKFGFGVGRRSTIVGVHDGTNTIVYINGKFAATAVTPLPPITAAKPMHIAERGYTNFFFNGDINLIGAGTFDLTPQQVNQFHREQMQDAHRI